MSTLLDSKCSCIALMVSVGHGVYHGVIDVLALAASHVLPESLRCKSRRMHPILSKRGTMHKIRGLIASPKLKLYRILHPEFLKGVL